MNAARVARRQRDGPLRRLRSAGLAACLLAITSTVLPAGLGLGSSTGLASGLASGFGLGLMAARADSGGLNGYESAFLGQINGLRASRGLAGLAVDAQATQVARNWAAQMAGSRTLAHNPNLGGQVSPGWTKLGENVGEGPNVATVWNAFVGSPPHLANLTDPSYTVVGIGVAVDSGGQLWTTHDFEARAGVAQPPPAPPPRPPAPPPPPSPSPPRSATPTFAATSPGSSPAPPSVATTTAPTTPTTAAPFPLTTTASGPSTTSAGHQVLVELEELRSLDATNG